MSINCWIIFQLDLPPRKARALLARHFEPRFWGRDYAVVLYEENRYQGFTELSAEEQEAAVERYLGDEVLAHLADPRGVCVEAEVGQSFKGMTYKEIATDGAHWVRCRADPAKGREPPRTEDAESAIEAILAWTTRAKGSDRDVAVSLTGHVLAARWEQLAGALESVPALSEFAPVFRRQAIRRRGEDLEPLAVPQALEAFAPPNARIVSLESRRGSRATARDYGTLKEEIIGDFFLPQFEALMPRPEFARESNNITVLQMEVEPDLARVRAFLSKAFERRKMQYELKQVKRTAAFAISGQAAGQRVMLKYYGDDERSRALITLIAIEGPPQPPIKG